MTGNAERAPIREIVPQFREGFERLDVVSLQSSATNAAELACIIISLKYGYSPFTIKCGAVLITMSQMVGSRLYPSFSC